MDDKIDLREVLQRSNETVDRLSAALVRVTQTVEKVLQTNATLHETNLRLMALNDRLMSPQKLEDGVDLRTCHKCGKVRAANLMWKWLMVNEGGWRWLCGDCNLDLKKKFDVE